MPGVNPPNDQRFAYELAQLHQRLRALETQQQSTITNQLGQPVLNFGLVPGSNPARYGLQFVDPASGNEQMFLGESSTGSALTIVLEGNGSITVKDSETGTTIAVIGALPSAYNRADGSAQPGLLYYREDGSLAAALADLNPTTPPYKQALQLFDRSGNNIVSDDTNGGVGLARPHLTGPQLTDTNTARWPGTANTTWTTIANAYFEIQQPRLSYVWEIYAPAATTGQFRLLVNGHQIGTTQTIANNAFGTWSEIAAVPTGTAFGSSPLIELQAQVTVGTGTVIAQQLFLEGTQSP